VYGTFVVIMIYMKKLIPYTLLCCIAFATGCAKEEIQTTISYRGELLTGQPITFSLVNKVKTARWNMGVGDTSYSDEIAPVFIYNKAGDYHVSAMGTRGNKKFIAHLTLHINAPDFPAIYGTRQYKWHAVTQDYGSNIYAQANGERTITITSGGNGIVIFNGVRIPYVSSDAETVYYSTSVMTHSITSLTYYIKENKVAATHTSGGMGGYTTTTYTSY